MKKRVWFKVVKYQPCTAKYSFDWSKPNGWIIKKSCESVKRKVGAMIIYIYTDFGVNNSKLNNFILNSKHHLIYPFCLALYFHHCLPLWIPTSSHWHCPLILKQLSRFLYIIMHDWHIYLSWLVQVNIKFPSLVAI